MLIDESPHNDARLRINFWIWLDNVHTDNSRSYVWTLNALIIPQLWQKLFHTNNDVHCWCDAPLNDLWNLQRSFRFHHKVRIPKSEIMLMIISQSTFIPYFTYSSMTPRTFHLLLTTVLEQLTPRKWLSPHLSELHNLSWDSAPMAEPWSRLCILPHPRMLTLFHTTANTILGYVYTCLIWWIYILDRMLVYL